MYIYIWTIVSPYQTMLKFGFSVMFIIPSGAYQPQMNASTYHF